MTENQQQDVGSADADRGAVRSAVQMLAGAHRDGGLIDPADLGGLTDVAVAYEVQDLVWDELTASGSGEPAGYKVSFTIPDVQAWVGATEPACGPFRAEQILASGVVWPRASLRDPVLEPEVVFHLHEDLPIGATRDDVRRCATISLGIEVCDSRMRGWLENPAIVPIVADGCVSGVLVTGRGDERLPVGEELASVTVELSRNGEHLQSGSGDRVLGDPIEAVVWLAGHLSRRDRFLRAGMVVSSGALTQRPIPARPGMYAATSPQLGTTSINIT